MIPLLRLYRGYRLHDILFALFTSQTVSACTTLEVAQNYVQRLDKKEILITTKMGGFRKTVQTSWNTGRPTTSIFIKIKRGHTHNREIIRTRPLCMNPSTGTQLCQTAWSIIFSNSWGLESYYRAPSVTQTSVPRRGPGTSWLFTPGFNK